jgi:hypothetical protein
VKYLDVPCFFPNGAPSASPKRDWWLRLVRTEAHSSEQACPFTRGGFLTLKSYLWCLFFRFFFPRRCALDLPGAP